MVTGQKSKKYVRTRLRRKIELTAIFLFILVNLVGPMFIGECYPLTISPMFCGQLSQYCKYSVSDPEGNELDLNLFSLHQVYDGNPVGLGVGLRPQWTLNKVHSVPPGPNEIEYVVVRGLRNVPDIPWVRVQQRVFGEVDGTVGELRPAKSWKIDRSGIVE